MYPGAVCEVGITTRRRERPWCRRTRKVADELVSSVTFFSVLTTVELERCTRTNLPANERAAVTRPRCLARLRAVLELVGGGVECAEHIPDAEGQARGAEQRRQGVERAPHGRACECQSEPGREERHRDGGEEGEEGECDDGDQVAVNRREQQDADTGASAQSVHDADRVGLER